MRHMAPSHLAHILPPGHSSCCLACASCARAMDASARGWGPMRRGEGRTCPHALELGIATRTELMCLSKRLQCSQLPRSTELWQVPQIAAAEPKPRPLQINSHLESSSLAQGQARQSKKVRQAGAFVQPGHSCSSCFACFSCAS